MDCREFERRLDDLLAGDARSRAALDGHAAACPECAELLALADLPLERKPVGPPDLTAAVLARTSGGACRQAETHLAGLVDGELAASDDRGLLEEHLHHCADCSAVVAELRRLQVDLPRLARVAPERSLVEEVLRRTLPAPVRLRRWWKATWPAWVRRPRFASELAYVASVILVVLFATPVSPLQAMPERAARLVERVPYDQIRELPEAAGDEVRSRWQVVTSKGAARGGDLTDSARAKVGTILEEIASWFVDDDETPASATETTKETT